MADDSRDQRPPGMPPVDGAEGPPQWDQDEADGLVGQYVLVGLTYLASDGQTVTKQVQFHGRILSADSKGFAVGREGQEPTWLPPDLRAFSAASPGEYRLRSTGEIVRDPDLLATWTITSPPQKS